MKLPEKIALCYRAYYSRRSVREQWGFVREIFLAGMAGLRELLVFLLSLIVVPVVLVYRFTLHPLVEALVKRPDGSWDRIKAKFEKENGGAK